MIKVRPNDRNGMKGLYPALVHGEWSIAGVRNKNYNCIAWSVGETDKWYERLSNKSTIIDGVEYLNISIDISYGNVNGIFEISDIDAFYDAKGYKLATNETDADIIYYSNFHAAKRMRCGCGAGKWLMFESKCGDGLRIKHVYNQLNGTMFGVPIRYYKKK